jgi:hypothetical protein
MEVHPNEHQGGPRKTCIMILSTWEVEICRMGEGTIAHPNEH